MTLAASILAGVFAILGVLIVVFRVRLTALQNDTAQPWRIRVNSKRPTTHAQMVVCGVLSIATGVVFLLIAVL